MLWGGQLIDASVIRDHLGGPMARLECFRETNMAALSISCPSGKKDKTPINHFDHVNDTMCETQHTDIRKKVNAVNIKMILNGGSGYKLA